METFNTRMRRDARNANWIAAAVLAGSIVIALLASGCRVRPRYGPTPPQNPAAVALDPRPDLPGVPVILGHPLYPFAQGLRLIAPPGRGVVVRSVPILDPFLGLTRHDPRVDPLADPCGPQDLVIEVRDDLELWIQHDVLLHEWAHVLAWGLREGPHGAVWGAWYSYLWRVTRGEL